MCFFPDPSSKAYQTRHLLCATEGRMQTMKRTLKQIVAVLVAGSAIGLGAGLLAQATPAEQAREILRGLTTRTSLPPVQELGRLESAPAAVCREIGGQLATSHPETARRLATQLASSDNSFAHAALLVAMGSMEEQIRRACVDALVTLPFGRLIELGPAAREMQPRIFEQLREDGYWDSTIVAKVTQLCSQDDRSRDSEQVRHQQIALALVVDLYGGPKGYRTIVDQLLMMLVGEATPEVEIDPDAESKPDEGFDPFDDMQPEPPEASDPEAERIRLMHERRAGAIEMFRRLLVIDPDGFFQLGKSAPYDRRVERAAEFWDRYGGVKLDLASSEDRDRDRARLIGQRYVERFGAVDSWRSHIEWVQREAATRDEQVMALVLMDELCGGVHVDAPKIEPKPGEDAPEDMGPLTVPAITGATPATKVENFLALDLRTGQRPRIRAIRAAFEEKLGEK